MGWTKHDDAIRVHRRGLLEAYSKLRKPGLIKDSLGLLYCRYLVQYVKLKDSLGNSALSGEPIDVEAYLTKLPPTSIILVRRGN